MDTESSGNSTADILQRDRDLQSHLEALGLATVEEYVQWCAVNGFSRRIDKNWKDRCRERYFANQETIQDRLAQKKAQRRQPRRVIERIFTGELTESECTLPHLTLIQKAAASETDQRTRETFSQLLLHVEHDTGLVTTRPACAQRGTQPGNTFVDGLLALARNRRHWLRPLKQWRPHSHNVRRQFSSFSRHLLARYRIPLFMDSVWFMPPSTETTKQQAWYVSLGNGESPRKLNLPIPITKRMAYHFLQAPKELSVKAALRWGQVIGLGGNVRLVKAILDSRIGTAFEHDEFWITFIQWFIHNPMFDPAQIGPLVDYIYRQKFEPQALAGRDGQGELQPPNSEFSMKGRSAASLLQDMRQWHADLRKTPVKSEIQWQVSGIGEFDWIEGVLESNNLRHWKIIELRSRKELHDEGRMMRHCVASYDNSCAFGGTSIWSLSVERNLGRRKRVLTIEVANPSKTICQIRGKANRLPSRKEIDVVQRWALQEGLVLAGHLGVR